MHSQQHSSHEIHRPILVTGVHRSGTTWVGKMLAASREVAYISEPLNLWHRPGVMNAQIEHWYTYISPRNENELLPALQDTLAYRYHLWVEIQSIRSLKDLLRMGRDLSIFTSGALRKQRPLLKDPFAVFSAPWFAQKLGCQVVITVRHPAAFASSLVRLDWSFDFNHLLGQPLLMEDWLEPYRDEMEAMLSSPGDVIGQSALLWRMVYKTVGQFRQSDPELLVIRHEDLSLRANQGFRELYQALRLTYTPQVQRAVHKSSSAENPKQLSKSKVHAVRLDSQANIHHWKERLSRPQIERIYSLTRDAAAAYYTDQEWE